MADGSVQGLTQDRYAAARAQFEENLRTGEDIGASFCATVEGEIVVDLWGGFADPAKTRAWERDTVINVYSTTKTMCALTALLIADRGELDFDASVAKYWPEFAANGKADVKVSHLMSHSAGLSGWKEKITTEDLYDWDKATSLLAAQAPYWPAGTAPGYHALTQGYLVGEVVRRITGKSLGTVFREEIAEPLGADFWIGLPASEDHRVAELMPPPMGVGDQPGQTELMKNMSLNPGIDISATKTRAWRGAEIPAAGGTGNARSVAQVHVILANGGVAQGKRFMSEAGCRKALELQVEGQDLILGAPSRFGLGFGLGGGMMPLPNPNDSMYWGGYGGSLILIDMKAHTTFAYVMNKMQPTTQGDMRGLGLAMAMWTAMGTI
ncbi:MAG TPA: serine hydrolase domain-containing protein [Phenylobacterium sp.]